MRHPNLDDLARRPVRYWNVDGLPDLMMGLLWIVWGGAWLIGQRIPQDSSWNLYWLVVPPALAASGFAISWATRRLKERLTFPRTGYVEVKEPSRAARVSAAAVAITAALALAVMVLTSDMRQVEQMATPVLSVILGLSFVVVSLKQRAPHYLAFAGVAVALGLSLSAIEGGWESMNWMFLGLGVACALVGGLRLTLFLRQHPRSAAEEL
jgi:peptidoglycan/LPS O-acetylase OafA/YrhL